MLKKLVIALALVPTFSYATTNITAKINSIRRTQQRCMNKAMSTADMSQCNAVAYTKGDKLLNSYYQSIVKNLNDGIAEAQKNGTADDGGDAETLKRLVAAERSWITFRDLDCNLAGIEMLGGSGERLVVGSCQVEKTLERIKHLNEIFTPEDSGQ